MFKHGNCPSIKLLSGIDNRSIMKPVERSKIQKLITKIESDCFDENDIDSLFMKLRAYSSGYSIFREVSDFVAHNDLRNRGIANQSLETMYLRMKFFAKYNSPKKTLDLSHPFPIWVKKLMKLQAEKCKEDDLKLKFNVTKKRLVNRIEGGFKEDKKNKVALYRQGKLSQETFSAIQYVLSFISAQEAFSQDQVINELISVLVKNKVEFNEESFRALSDKITVCILLLFHHAYYYFFIMQNSTLKAINLENVEFLLKKNQYLIIYNMWKPTVKRLNTLNHLVV